MTNSLFLKTKGEPYIAPSKSQTLENCGVFLEGVVDHELRDAMIAANINILRREAPYAFFFAYRVTLEEWSSSRLLQRQPYLKSLESKQLQLGVCLTNPDFDTTTVVTAVLLGDILPLATPMQEDGNCLICLPKASTLEDIDALFANGRGVADSLRLLLEDGGFLVTTIDHFVLEVRTSDKRVLEYFAS